MTEEDMYEEYEVEDNTPKGPDKDERKLPQIIQNWKETGAKYSKYNSFPLTMCYFNILGQITKDFIQIPNDGNKHDTRLHFIWLQTARTGKSAVWGFMNGVLQGTYDKINAHRKTALTESSTEEEAVWYKDKEKWLKKSNIFGITVYTSAGLIGSFIENDKFKHTDTDDFRCNTLQDAGLNICNCETENNPRKLFIPGALHGSGIAHWDEFESSGIFNNKKHNEDMLVTFQTFMNNIDIESEGHVITKYLAGVTSIGKCDCQRSLYATSYVPQNLAEVIRNSGVLQRAFIWVRTVPEETRADIANHIIDTMGQDSSDDIDVSQFINHFENVYETLLEKRKTTKPTEMIIIPDNVKEVMKNTKTTLDDHVKNSLPEIKESVNLFINNLIIYHIKIAALITIARGVNYTISVNDANCAGDIVEKAYKELVGWLEHGMRIQASSLSNKAGLNIFVQVYMDSTKNEDDYVEKDSYMDKVGAELKKAPATVYRYWKQIKNDFEETNIGRTKYIKYIGE